MENDRRGKPNPHASDPTGATSILERRRLAKVVHDDRGNAQVEWVEAPSDHERVHLSLEDDADAGSKRPGGGYDPYQKAAKARPGGPPDPPERPGKRDLRKLSDWIKQMRELEARKQRGEGTDD
jgi:hypothetical protein